MTARVRLAPGLGLAIDLEPEGGCDPSVAADIGYEIWPPLVLKADILMSQNIHQTFT
jgi:hypothetical protein